MKKYLNPKISEWVALTNRPQIDQNKLNDIVTNIINNVAQNGDKALLSYASEFDNATLDTVSTSKQEVEEAIGQVPNELKTAIALAFKNIKAFHESQKLSEKVIETSVGVQCWRKNVAIEKVGLYIPGGTAPLFSTILMLGIPAKIAGCKEIVLCTPPSQDGKINPAILYTAQLVGIHKIFKVGGAQAIAAMSHGTESIPKVYKIFGPGNQYVTKAKALVQQQGTAIDMPAGPSEVLIIADKTCQPTFVAADLLSQAEHGKDSQVILLSDDEKILDACIEEVNQQVVLLPRKSTALEALSNSKALVLNSIDECFEFSNMYAPEHLIIAMENASGTVDKITNAGSVFLGNYSCESAGDYASGTNHTLPTNGYARNYSGVSLDSFVKKITYQELSKEGLCQIGQAIEIMASAENLIAHKNAVSIRLKKIYNE